MSMFDITHQRPCYTDCYSLAYAEMRLIMARMVWNFDITLAEDSQNWMETNELFILWDNPPLNVYLTPHSSV